jgi:hypothetical protein
VLIVSNLRTSVIAWIHKVPLWVWIFLVFTQVGHAYKGYRDTQVSQQLLDERVRLEVKLPPDFATDFVESAQSLVDRSTQGFWWAIIALPVFAACAAIRYFGPPAASDEDSARTDVSISAPGSARG